MQLRLEKSRTVLITIVVKEISIYESFVDCES